MKDRTRWWPNDDRSARDSQLADRLERQPFLTYKSIVMTTLNDFTSRQLRYALAAIQKRIDMVVYLTNDIDLIHSGKCEEFEALTLFKVQLLMALERSEKVDKTWSN